MACFVYTGHIAHPTGNRERDEFERTPLLQIVADGGEEPLRQFL
jgi:hypothetical protein